SEALTMADRIGLLENGRLQQLGTPQQLYGEPANRFVAEFIGQPKINLIEGRVEEGRLLPFGIDFSESNINHVTIGLRPEAIRIGSDGQYRGVVRSCEYSGDQYIAQIAFGDNQLTVARLEQPLDISAEVPFDFEINKLLFFDQISGERIVPGRHS
ncbi:MAG: TOBE domain-containing protein, partial [candidate division Zixibacteria bacterium]